MSQNHITHQIKPLSSANGSNGAAKRSSVEDAVRMILRNVGDDPNREGLQRTPGRVAGTMEEIYSGYRVDPDQLLEGALFKAEFEQMVVVKDIEFFSMCEHHMLPFYGHAHIGYIPGEHIIGLSKIPEIVEMYARRLQVQERMTEQIASLMNRTLKPTGLGIIIEAAHLCARMRGVKSRTSLLVTSVMRGSFKEDPMIYQEFTACLNR